MATPSREEGGGVVRLRWSRTFVGETERSTTATLSLREEKTGKSGACSTCAKEKDGERGFRCKDRWTKRGGVNWAFFKI
jgi:hypothetical protein